MTARFVSPAPAEMTAEQQAILKMFNSGRRVASGSAFSLVDGSGRLQGPPAVWVLVPPLARVFEQLGSAMRYELTLPGRAREIAILAVAHHHRSPFELYAHTRAATSEGLTAAELDALAAGLAPEFRTETERVTYAVTRRVIDTGTLADEEYAEAVRVLTEEGLFEVITLIGYYTMLAYQLSVFGLLPPGESGD